ncbi:MAG: hypothetical protein RLZZ437_2301 [Pseudomonadota bacterium]|jgi:hypothetical protein
MSGNWNIPPFAASKLPGKTVKSVSESFPHHVSIEFTDGAVISFTAMPFKDGIIDVGYVPSLDDK